MVRRFAGGAFLLLVVLAFSGCRPPADGPADERKNPYYVAGKERLAARDYKGAIAAFEKALELNPRSPLTHFELGVLYEQHGDQKDTDYVSAIYHYAQVIRLRPNEYPADNARQRIAGCKQELVKAESLAPVAQSVLRDLDRLREENKQLKQKLEQWEKAQAAGRATAGPSQAEPAWPASSPFGAAGPGARGSPTVTARAANPGASSSGARPAPSASRSYTVRPGDTPYSIARAHGVRLDALLAANPGLEPRRMKAGQVVKIPPS
jgi:LysM repeat protein